MVQGKYSLCAFFEVVTYDNQMLYFSQKIVRFAGICYNVLVSFLIMYTFKYLERTKIVPKTWYWTFLIL